MIEKDGENSHVHFVGGGIESGDSEIETVSKELMEESGYTDFSIV